MSFRITGLSPNAFQSLYGLPDEELAVRGVLRYVVNENPGYPDRVEMREARVGETVLLLNHFSLPVDTPYRASHAIFVREGATEVYDAIDEVPEVMRRRLLSLRAFDQNDMMVDADVIEGSRVETVIERLFSDPAVSYIHVHNAKQGCYSGRVDRVDG
ncbi:DUF1203 domain-containing protein [Pleomorphomonas sp. JP5]|uniref:DUF1203 domain-containing protein n=1 Tax=Pleomorphomonas sp. JP5 TaxID=2942998 RepID=UPI002043485C|nr:DUF1203 domain-containing protein [Pleomorphomonas sp. JP5]MCM5556445.1 DUF1203 domain-containing protein [Pleomorphomonas sp. JP5]